MSINSQKNRQRRLEKAAAARRRGLTAKKAVAVAPLPRRALPTTALRPQLKAGLDMLEAEGIRVKPGSRVAQYIKLIDTVPFDEATGTWTEDDLIAKRTIAFVEGAVIADILSAIPALKKSNGFKQHMRDLLSGDFWPDAPDDSSRAKQLELWFAARCALAGLEVSLDEPDVRITVDGETFGAAAKRVRSPEKLRTRVVEGVEQLHRAGLPGFLVLDYSWLLRTNSTVWMTDKGDEGARRVMSAVDEMNKAGNFRRWIEPKDPGKRVAGIVGVGFSASIERSTAGITAHRWMRMGPLHPGGRRGQRIFDRLLQSR